MCVLCIPIPQKIANASTKFSSFFVNGKSSNLLMSWITPMICPDEFLIAMQSMLRCRNPVASSTDGSKRSSSYAFGMLTVCKQTRHDDLQTTLGFVSSSKEVKSGNLGQIPYLYPTFICPKEIYEECLCFIIWIVTFLYTQYPVYLLYLDNLYFVHSSCADFNGLSKPH